MLFINPERPPRGALIVVVAFAMLFSALAVMAPPGGGTAAVAGTATALGRRGGSRAP